MGIDTFIHIIFSQKHLLIYTQSQNSDYSRNCGLYRLTINWEPGKY